MRPVGALLTIISICEERKECTSRQRSSLPFVPICLSQGTELYYEPSVRTRGRYVKCLLSVNDPSSQFFLVSFRCADFSRQIAPEGKQNEDEEKQIRHERPDTSKLGQNSR